MEKVKFEVLDLLANDEDVATTLLMLPFAFSSFSEWNGFILQLEDEVMPLLEKETGYGFSSSPKDAEVTSRRRSLFQRSNELTSQSCSSSSYDERIGCFLPDIKLAFFHPLFCWANEDFDAPLNFEKRAPFPTINFLRAKEVRKLANRAQSTAIADNNYESLMKAENLNDDFENIIKVAFSRKL